MTFTQSTPIVTRVRTAFMTSSLLSALIPIKLRWPAVVVIGIPQACMRGPSRCPSSIAFFKVRVTPKTSAQSRTVVTPPCRARRAFWAASITDSTALL